MWRAIGHYFTAINIIRIAFSGVAGWRAAVIPEVWGLSTSALFFIGLGGFTLSIWAFNGVIWLWQRSKTVKATTAPTSSDTRLQHIRDRTFRNETVQLDGHHFSNCTFVNVTLSHNGGSYSWSNATFRGMTWVHSDKPELVSHRLLCKHAGLFKDTVVFGKDIGST